MSMIRDMKSARERSNREGLGAICEAVREAVREEMREEMSAGRDEKLTVTLSEALDAAISRALGETLGPVEKQLQALQRQVEKKAEERQEDQERRAEELRRAAVARQSQANEIEAMQRAFGKLWKKTQSEADRRAHQTKRAIRRLPKENLREAKAAADRAEKICEVMARASEKTTRAAERLRKAHRKQRRQERWQASLPMFVAMVIVAVLIGWAPVAFDKAQNWWTGVTEVELTAAEQRALKRNAQDAARMRRIEDALGEMKEHEQKVFRGMLENAEARVEKSYPRPIIPKPVKEKKSESIPARWSYPD